MFSCEFCEIFKNSHGWLPKSGRTYSLFYFSGTWIDSLDLSDEESDRNEKDEMLQLKYTRWNLI